MAELVAWVVAATAVEVAALPGVVHALLTGPLLRRGAVLVCASLDRVVAVAALRAERGGAAASPRVALARLRRAVGAAVMWFGVRAVGKLY